MKRFEFSLKKLLGYKQQILKKEKNDLANLRKQQMLLIDDMNCLAEKKTCKNLEFVAKMNKGLSPQHVALHKNFIQSLNDQIKSYHLKIEQLETSIQKQLEVIIELTKEIDSLEKLEKKQREEYTKIEQKQNELFIEEFVSHKSFQEAK